MPETARFRQTLPLLLLGLALGYLAGRRAQAATLDEVAQYRQTARDARRLADELRQTETRRTYERL